MSTGVQTKVGTFIWHENHSTDVEKSKSFYTGLLGWQTETWPGEMEYTIIKVGDKGHGGFMAAQEAPSRWLGHVLVEDTDEVSGRSHQLRRSVGTNEHGLGMARQAKPQSQVVAGALDLCQRDGAEPRGGRMVDESAVQAVQRGCR